MRKEMKICIAPYKIAYSLLFLLLSSLVIGVAVIPEIGRTMIPQVAVLTIVFCAETRVMEGSGQRWEIVLLKPLSGRIQMIYKRWLIQSSYLYVVSLAGYFAFFWQKPYAIEDHPLKTEYLDYALALLGTILFWSFLSIVISNLTKNQWIGIGASAVIWIITNSKVGEELFGRYNLFAYSASHPIKGRAEDWIFGTILQIVLAALLALCIPWIEKRVSK